MLSSTKLLNSLMLLLLAAFAVKAYSVSFANGNAPANLRWKAATISIGISASLLSESSNIKRGSDVEGAVERSLEAWQRTANIEFRQYAAKELSASPAGPSGDGISLITIAQTPENVLLFAKDPELVAATTRVFYNGRGVITEADIVLNPYQQFSTDGTIGTFDLESAITHELGHLLGLEHSPLLASTMYENYGKNGVYGLNSFNARTLSADDIAAVRAIYGPKDSETACCGTISGKLNVTGIKSLKNAEIWLEDSVTGRVQGRTRAAADGVFTISGLAPGDYRVFAEVEGANAVFQPQEIGEAAIIKGESTEFAGRFTAREGGMRITYVGFNGQLSGLPIQLSAGKTYTVYLGGTSLDAKTATVGINSPFFNVVAGSLRQHDYGDQVSVISFEVRVSAETPSGDFSIEVTNSDGGKAYIRSGLTVDEFANPFSILTSVND